MGKNKQQVSNEKLHIKLIIFGLSVLSFIVSVEHCYENAVIKQQQCFLFARVPQLTALKEAMILTQRAVRSIC